MSERGLQCRKGQKTFSIDKHIQKWAMRDQLITEVLDTI